MGFKKLIAVIILLPLLVYGATKLKGDVLHLRPQALPSVPVQGDIAVDASGVLNVYSGTAWATQAATRPFWDANIGGGNTSLGTSNTTSYSNITNSSFSLTQNSSSESIGIACGAPATEEQEVGDTTCSGSEGDELIGVVITPSKTGAFKACFEFAHFIEDNNAVANLSVNVIFQIIETASNSLTISAEGNSRIQSTLTTNSGGGAEVISVVHPYNLCGIFIFSDTNNKRITLRYEQNITGTVSSNTIFGDEGASLGQRDIHFYGYYID